MELFTIDDLNKRYPRWKHEHDAPLIETGFDPVYQNREFTCTYPDCKYKLVICEDRTWKQ